MKIAHLTSAHSRYDIRIFKKQCISLSKNRENISLIVADGLGDEFIEGVQIIDVGLAANRFARFLNLPSRILNRVEKEGFDICHFHDPELLLIATKLREKGIKVIYDIHEDLPKQIMLKTWIPGFLRNAISKAFAKYERFVSAKLDALVVPQPYMLKEYKKINNKTYLIENFVILHSEMNMKSFKQNERSLSFHAGRLTEDRGFFNMVNAFQKSEKYSDLILAGNYNNEVESSLNTLEQFKNIHYLGAIPFEKTVEYYRKCDFGIILYNNVGQYYLSYAIKLFEYMSYGIPVIMPNFGEWTGFNKENNCGINVDPGNPEAVSEAIKLLTEDRELIRRLGKNGAEAVKNKYNWKIAETKLLSLYQNLQ